MALVQSSGCPSSLRVKQARGARQVLDLTSLLRTNKLLLLWFLHLINRLEMRDLDTLGTELLYTNNTNMLVVCRKLGRSLITLKELRIFSFGPKKHNQALPLHFALCALHFALCRRRLLCKDDAQETLTNVTEKKCLCKTKEFFLGKKTV